MSEQRKSALNGIRLLGIQFERFITGGLTDGQPEKLTDGDVKHIALLAFMMVTELKERLDAYETRGAKEWMSVAEAMDKTGCSKRTIFRAIKNRDLRSQKVNGRRVVERQSVDQFADYRSI